ncbi:iron transporter [Haloplanus pelagicus]|uniref:iron transporter n=1 Tax=Haloplanus pelagicus TaxID=2949995 RepID=UPI0020425FCA|nr:iron transporter [Haloplanus sp. HW8-1]
MKRRELLRTGVALSGALALAGCSSLVETRAVGVPPVPEDRPDGVYYPSHVEGMSMAGRATSGDYAAGLMYSYPHRFWNVTGESVSLTDIESDDAVHLMASIWDPKTRTILPDTGLSAEIYRDGSLVSQEAIYPMLSQPMGFHYGANFGLEGDGTYEVRLSIGAMATRRTGAFAGRFTDPATVTIPFEYSQSAKEGIEFRTLEEKVATPGAVEPMRMDGLPASFAPLESELPGRVLGSGTSNDARLVVTALDALPEGIDGSADGTYLVVSARTRYNRMVIPAMGLSGRLERDGRTIYEGAFERTLDPELGYHYGAVVDGVASGDDLTLSVTVQPQTARHEGYETAFGGLMGDMPDVTVRVP